MGRRAGAVAAMLLVASVASSTPIAAASSASAHFCASAVSHGPDRSAPTPLPQVRGCRYDTGATIEDPAIAVSRTGVLFVAMSMGGVQRSTDEGQHWTYVPVPALANGDAHTGGHGFVHVDPRTDRLYYLTSLAVPSCGGLAGSVLSWSDDLGRTWQGKTVSCDTYDWGRVVTGPAPSGNAYPSAIYFLGVAQRPVGGQRLVYRSLDGGKTWQKTKNIASATTESGAGVTAPDGTIYFDYPEFLGFDPTRVVNQTYPFQPGNVCKEMIAVSEDYGESWRQQAIPGSLACNENTGQERVAVDRAGVVYALWNDDRDGQLRMVVSRDKARTWSTPIDVLPPGATFNNSNGNIIAGAPGHIFIASQNTHSPVDPRVSINQGVGDWDTYITESFNATAAKPRFTSVDLDPAGDPTYSTGEQPTEAECGLAMSPSGQGWTTFTRATGPGVAAQTAGRAWVARMEPAAAAPANEAETTAERRPTKVRGAQAVTAPGRELAATGLGWRLPTIAGALLMAAAAILRRVASGAPATTRRLE